MLTSCCLFIHRRQVLNSREVFVGQAVSLPAQTNSLRYSNTRSIDIPNCKWGEPANISHFLRAKCENRTMGLPLLQTPGILIGRPKLRMRCTNR